MFNTAVLELSYRAYDQRDVHDNITILLNCLRLFRLGSVSLVKTELHPKSILNHSSTSGPIVLYGKKYDYHLSNEDVLRLKEFMDRMSTFSPKQVFVPPPGDATPISIAVQRFNGALLNSEGIESQITSAITCLEALYLKAEERMELAHRLSQRASVILGFLDFPPIEIYRVLTKAYEIRSIYIHGAQIKPEEQRNIIDLARKVMDYARLSILIFIQINWIIDKDSLIGRIDKSLLDERVRKKLKDDVDENCRIYK